MPCPRGHEFENCGVTASNLRHEMTEGTLSHRIFRFIFDDITKLCKRLLYVLRGCFTFLCLTKKLSEPVVAYWYPGGIFGHCLARVEENVYAKEVREKLFQLFAVVLELCS